MSSILSHLKKVSKDGNEYSFETIPSVMDVPYLLETQKVSYETFLQKDIAPSERENLGLQEAFASVFPITSPSTPTTLEFLEYTFGVPKYSIRECTERGMTFSVPLKVKLQLIVREQNEETGQIEIRDIKEQETYMGEVPLMTEQGTFIINGAERVIVSQLHRSPGVSFSSSIHPNGKTTYSARVIPYRGAWIEFEIDISNVMSVIVDRRRKIPATTFLRLMGLSRDHDIGAEFFEIETISLDDFRKGATKLADLPRFVGETVVEELVNSKTGKKIASPGTKVTKKLIDQIDQAGIKKVVLSVAEAYSNIVGRFLSEDVIDHRTGEILGECFERIGTVFLMRCAECGIAKVKALKVPHEDTNVVLCTLAKDKTKTHEDAVIDFFRKMRPGNPVTQQNAHRLVEDMFFNEKRYDLGLVGRHKINHRFGLDGSADQRILVCDDIVKIMKHMLKLVAETEEVDDIDHLGNRRVRSVGELLQNQVRLALAEVEKTARERMGIIDLENMLPHNLINAKPVDSAIKDFFGRSQLSQFMDQTNPLSELTHKRRLSALGPGGLSRDRAGFEVRDVHHSHYGRICPIETPEGPNIGLISSLCSYARINPYGFIETPYRKVSGGKVTQQIEYLTADIEDDYQIAQANAPFSEDGSFTERLVQCRFRGDVVQLPPEKIEYMDISPKQVVSVSASLIPFLEHDDANRALMGSNMMRQAVPLLYTEPPVVGTGMEGRVAQDSGVTVTARNAGEVVRATSTEIIVRTSMGGEDYYPLIKYRRSNQNTCINQRPVVTAGTKVKKGAVLADGPATSNGILALGRNLLVAFMPWGGYNFEDAIIVSERLVRDDLHTSIHIEEFEIDARDTKLGKEEITRDIPNVSEEALSKLDEEGLVYVGAEVNPGDILVGKVTPKGETDLTSEEKLLRVIFGEKAGDVRDASLRCPPGTQGIVVDIKVFSRKERTARSDRQDKEIVAGIETEREERLSRVWSEFNEKLSDLLADVHHPVVSYEDGSVILKPGGRVTQKVLEYVRRSLQTGMLPVDGKTGGEIKVLFQDTMARDTEIQETAKNRIDRIKTGDELPPGVIKLVKVYVATKRKISVGDKMAGRHGNKGVISKILPIEDMPFLDDGTPVDIILNPLGVPSRMNVGQILETHLGWAMTELGYVAATAVFDGAGEEQIRQLLKEADLPETGQTMLHDGLTGEPFARPITVGSIYMLKLAHMVDDKMHARSIGPYSLVTQQPLGGKAQFGGQRFGEMEVWALEAYGAANTLQELLTVKSDDVVGRTKIYESIIKGQNTLSPGVPESFNVLVKELQSLCLNMELINTSDLGRGVAEYDEEFDEVEIGEADLRDMDTFDIDEGDEDEDGEFDEDEEESDDLDEDE
ncbi:DNA-directed RNA polymerase subunit beta [Candidatus Sumerlaeota bacterium]|nr:DNA-directed RNA polymerase subunit beta [Candidatus Sumerlaeota bacterium]